MKPFGDYTPESMTMRGNPSDPIAYAIAEKQLYSSHYFETALDLTFVCATPLTRSNQAFI